MAGSVNKVILVGNLGRDPEVRRTQSNQKIVHLSVATSERWKDRQSSEARERTEWHRVAIFDEHLAEIAERYLRKGSPVYPRRRLARSATIQSTLPHPAATAERRWPSDLRSAVSPRSSRLTWSATAGWSSRTRRAPWRGFASDATPSSCPSWTSTVGACSSRWVTASWSSSRVPSTPCAAPWRCRSGWRR